MLNKVRRFLKGALLPAVWPCATALTYMMNIRGEIFLDFALMSIAIGIVVSIVTMAKGKVHSGGASFVSLFATIFFVTSQSGPPTKDHLITLPTTPLIAFLVLGAIIALGLTVVTLIIANRDSIRQSKLDRERAEQDELAHKIKKTVGDDVLAKGFLLALEKLTQYAPDEAEPLLKALLADAEEYAMLESLIGSTKNDMLHARSEAKQDAIRQAAQELCTRLTEDALEAVRRHEDIEADRILGDENEPRLVSASKNFVEYLNALRETHALTPSAERALRQEIDSLGQPAEVKQLPVDSRVRGWVSKI